MVVESTGDYKYPDKGNMTKAEIDSTMEVLTEAKKAGQFRAFWKDFNESVNLMASGETVIQSMWSPAVTAVRSKGIPCIYPAAERGLPRLGVRLRACRRASRSKKADLAYEFVNWFLDGWAGAYLNRQGYYSAVLETAKAKMEPYEWAFWMEGKPAEKDIKAPDGSLLEKAGANARRRLLRRPHGRRRLLERGHGRERLHGPQSGTSSSPRERSRRPAARFVEPREAEAVRELSPRAGGTLRGNTVRSDE